MFGVSISVRQLDSWISGRSACVIATVPRIFTFSASDQTSGPSVQMGPELYTVSGMMISPAKVRWWGSAPRKACCGVMRYWWKRSMAVCVVDGYKLRTISFDDKLVEGRLRGQVGTHICDIQVQRSNIHPRLIMDHLFFLR